MKPADKVQMNRCKNCKWWDQDDAGEWKYSKHHRCIAEDSEELDTAASENGEPYNGGSLYTGPDYGCIHWELQTVPWVPKPPAPAKEPSRIEIAYMKMISEQPSPWEAIFRDDKPEKTK